MNIQDVKELRRIRTEEYKKSAMDISRYYLLELNKEQLSNMKIGELLQVMDDIPKMKYYKSIYLGHVLLELSKIEREIKILEANELDLVNNDLNLKNQSQRDAKVTIKLNTNVVYTELTDYLNELQMDKNIFASQRDYYDDLNKNIKIEVKIKHELNMLEKGIKNTGYDD
jgi:hypothetical protein